MSDVFEDCRQGLAPSPAHQALQRSPDQGQRAGGVGTAQQTSVLAPASVSLPVPALTAPVGLDHLGHGLGTLALLIPTGNKVPGQFFIHRLLLILLGRRVLVGGGVGGFEQLFGFGKIGALRVSVHTAQLAQDGASVLAVGCRKGGRLAPVGSGPGRARRVDCRAPGRGSRLLFHV